MKNLKKAFSLLLAMVMVLSLGMTAAFAAPPAAPTKESDDYTGSVIDYEDKELWFKSDLYGGFYSPYQIMSGNGDDTFDVDAFINSKQGELIMSRIKYELALVGDSNYASQTMIDYWKEQGIIETAYNSDDHDHEWLTYVPDYMMAEDNTEVYPVVFSHHGNGGTLFEATDHGFVHICYDEGFMVVVPENENTDAELSIEMLPKYLDQMEEMGYPIDRSRVYVAGMSKGGATTLQVGLACSDIVAAIAPHSSSFGMLMEGSSIESFLNGTTHTMVGSVTQADLDACGGMPVWMQVGECDMNQLPFEQGMIDSLNAWLEMNDCPTRAVATDDNLIGITADRVYELKIDGTTYTFAEFYNTDGVKTMVVVGVEGLPHWVSYSYSKLAWDFMSQYSIVDGQRVYTEKAATYYNDVDNDADYATAVQAVTEAGLMTGTGVNTFSPDRAVTRAQVITVLGRLAGAVPTDIYGVADVKAGSWYSGYVGWAVANGIVTLKDGKFDPNGTITGTELDEIFTAYAELTGVDYINFPAYSNMSPAPVTRSELAVRLNKLMNAPVNYDYEDKELWYDTTLYGGFYSPYQIVMGNGDSTFDMPAFVNSKQGELVMSRIKYELALVGDKNYASQTMIDYWAAKGIIETVHESDTPEQEWLLYTPDYMTAKDNTEQYPVVFCFHGGGGTLFEATDHGFVDICYDEGFMVVVPENNGMDAQTCVDSVELYVSKLEKMGYPVDRFRVYVTGMSLGGVMTMYTGLQNSDTVAAIAAHSSIRMFAFDGELYQGIKDSTLASLETSEGIPVYIQTGGSDSNHLPFSKDVIDGLNKWLEMNDCPTKAEATGDNVIGITADKVYEMDIDGTTYTFAEYYNTAGDKTMVIAAVDNLPHWVSYSYSRLAWNFMSQYTNK